MPQPDRFTYLTQFVWLCVLYSAFYVFLYHDGSPKTSRILKLRKHLISLGATQGLGSATFNCPAGVKSSAPCPSIVEQDVVSEEGFNTSVSYPYSRISGALSWCNRMVKSLKIQPLRLRMNDFYVCSLGEIHLSEVLEEHALDLAEGSPSYYHSTSLASSWHTVDAIRKIIVLRGQERI
uniref:H(+)-transporting two-sector ATPase n=1 Tax=Ophioglossum californicum TaxID=1267209 RepID=A0A1B3TRF1_9MONI|nr:ATPase subunit 8 [Ophioglossum californicum]YP_010439833.1 ATPase subunit 8 [Ophioglossum vulgatum]AOH05886.1 ATPase subunit 8 [Ophioglossum californicum]UTD44879.1 ATPase subunit 8 [Ophioglossum vulgatum]